MRCRPKHLIEIVLPRFREDKYELDIFLHIGTQRRNTFFGETQLNKHKARIWPPLPVYLVGRLSERIRDEFAHLPK